MGGEVPAKYNITQNRIYISDVKDMTNPDVTPFTNSGDGFIMADKLVFLLVLLLFFLKFIFKFIINLILIHLYIFF